MINDLDCLLDIGDTISLLKRSVVSLETRFANRALRGTASYRDLVTTEILKALIESHVNGTFPLRVATVNHFLF